MCKKDGANGSKCNIFQSLCVICNCNSITVPPRRAGICCRMSRSNSLLWVMVFSLLGKWNIISLNRDMQNEVPTDPSWMPAQSVCGCWVAPQWQIQLIIETSRSWKSGDLEIYGHLLYMSRWEQRQAIKGRSWRMLISLLWRICFLKSLRLTY